MNAPLLSVLPPARTAKLPHRGAVYRQGEKVSEVFCLLEGQVTLARTNAQGESLTTAALAAGDLFGPALDGAAVAEDAARAKGAIVVWRVPADEFQRLLLAHPAFAVEVVAYLARRQRRLERRLESLAFKSTEARLAAIFRELSGGYVTRCEHGFGEHLRLTQQELADLVGASRPVVSTILNRLRKAGVVGYNRDYVCVRRIEDLDQLSEP